MPQTLGYYAGILQAATSALAPAVIVFNRPGTGQTANITATRGRSRLEADDQAGGRIETIVDDFLVPAAALVISNIQVTPQEGDQVIVGAQVFECAQIPYSPSDSTGAVVRIHTNRIA